MVCDVRMKGTKLTEWHGHRNENQNDKNAKAIAFYSLFLTICLRESGIQVEFDKIVFLENHSQAGANYDDY